MPIYALEPGWEPQIHPDAYIHPDAVLIGKVIIGARTSIQDGAVLHCTAEWKTVIGDNCTIGHNAHLEGCTLEDAALAGSGSVILHGAVVSSGALVGANALLPGGKIVPPNAMALGVPAKFREDACSVELNMLNADSYAERGRRYREHLRPVDGQGRTDH